MESKHAAPIRLLFSTLKEVEYQWHPQTPDRLIALRKEATPFSPLVQAFGLGLPVPAEALMDDGLSLPILRELEAIGFLEDHSFDTDSSETVSGRVLRSRMAVSGSGDLFIIHDHWPPSETASGGYVHLGPESWLLMEACRYDAENFQGKRILDLGCSSGVLSFGLCRNSAEVLGLDVSSRAIEWARTLAAAYGFEHFQFEEAAIGSSAADGVAADSHWDIAVMNPPMMIPSKEQAHPHRDGGELGIELPFRFLDFCEKHLNSNGEVYMLATNPIVNGRPVFFDRLKDKKWNVTGKQRLHSQFNQAVARKQGYEALGVERIELWFVQLVRR